MKDILLITKKSTYELQQENPSERVASYQAAHPEELPRLRESHERQRRSLDSVRETLERLHLSHDELYRAHLGEGEVDYRLLLVHGGDGTFIEATHHHDKLPIIGVNSDPMSSVGFYCGYTKDTLKEALRDLDAAPRTRVTRIAASINGKPVRDQALNEAMIAYHAIGPGISYHLKDDAGERSIRSAYSLMASTGGGSSGGIASFGGTPFPPDSLLIEYLSIGIPGEAPRFTKTLEIESLTDKGLMALDPHWRHPFGFGDRIVLTAGTPITLIGDLEKKRR
jgi:NAD kinase